MECDESFLTCIEHRTLDDLSSNRVRPIEDHEAFALFGGGLHGFSHRRYIRIEPCSDVLDIEHDGVDLREHFGGGFSGLTVETVDDQPCIFVLRIIDFGDIEFPFEAMFGTEQSGQGDAGCFA